MNSINSLTNNVMIPNQLAKLGDQTKTEESFKTLMVEGLQQVNQMQQQADQAVESLFTGGDANAAEVLTAIQKADMSFKLMLQVRNKMMQAYQEVKDIRI